MKECCYAECNYAECRGTTIGVVILSKEQLTEEKGLRTFTLGRSLHACSGWAYTEENLQKLGYLKQVPIFTKNIYCVCGDNPCKCFYKWQSVQAYYIIRIICGFT